MDVTKIVEQIVIIPRRFLASGESMVELLRETGYFECNAEVAVSDIYKALQSDSDLIESWLAWSENKRTDSGWYFEPTPNGKFVVGYFPKLYNRERDEYPDSHLACANFIKLEIEETRISLASEA